MNAPVTATLAAESSRVIVVPITAISQDWDDAWRDLAAHASEPNPFAEIWFMRPAIKHLLTLSDVHMLTVWEGARLIGMMAVAPERSYGRQPISHLENWMHYHCFLGTPLMRLGSEAAFWQGALSALDDAPWAKNFLHLVGLDPTGPVFAALQSTRQADIVHRSERAMLATRLDRRAYLEANVRPKKRKELRRLRARLDELGVVRFDRTGDGDGIDHWSADYLALEASGWKGRERTALADDPATHAFFIEMLRGAADAGRLDMLRLAIDGRPIAMLINFVTPPGCFAFKIAFDEAFAKYSPGVLLKIQNLELLDRADIAWTDSCAVEDHPMINSLWAERRTIVRVTIPLAGMRRTSMFHVARTGERASAWLRRHL